MLLRNLWGEKKKKKVICCVCIIFGVSLTADGGRYMNHCVYISTSRSRPIGHLFGSLLLLWFEMLFFIFFFFKTWVRFQMWKSSDRLGSFETCFTALEREICDCVRHIFNTHKKRRWLEIYLSSFFNFSFYFFFLYIHFYFLAHFLCVYT
jgi:hypothetical protein